MSSYALYLDDIRCPPQTNDNWVLCRTLASMLEVLEARGLPELISFDYELGRTDPAHCGYDAVEAFLRFMLENAGSSDLSAIEVRLHTSSGAGEARMARLLKERGPSCEAVGIHIIHRYGES